MEFNRNLKIEAQIEESAAHLLGPRTNHWLTLQRVRGRIPWFRVQNAVIG